MRHLLSRLIVRLCTPAGRDFGEREGTPAGREVALIGEAFARRGFSSRPEPFVPVIHEVARGVPLRPEVQWTRTLGAQMAEPVALFRGLSVGLIALGGVALVLACTGIHAIVAFSLAQRRRELAVRIALGACAATLARALLSRTLRQLAMGAIGGVLVAVLVTRFMDVIPFDVPRSDASLLGLIIILLAGAGVLACASPLKRALALRPLDWLREG